MLTINQRGLVRIGVSGSEAMTLNEAKAYLRVDTSADDNLITDLITLAREHAEHYLKRAIIDQDWRLSLADYAPLQLRLPMGSVRSINSVTKIESPSVSTILSSDYYSLKGGQDMLEFSEIIYAPTVQIEYSTGYADPSDIPQTLRYGMLAHIANLYDRRGDAPGMLPQESLALYSGYKEVLL